MTSPVIPPEIRVRLANLLVHMRWRRHTWLQKNLHRRSFSNQLLISLVPSLHVRARLPWLHVLQRHIGCRIRPLVSIDALCICHRILTTATLAIVRHLVTTVVVGVYSAVGWLIIGAVLIHLTIDTSMAGYFVPRAEVGIHNGSGYLIIARVLKNGSKRSLALAVVAPEVLYLRKRRR